MSAILLEKQMDNVRFEIEEVETLPIDLVSGKFRLVVRKPPVGARLPLPERAGAARRRRTTRRRSSSCRGSKPVATPNLVRLQRFEFHRSC